MKIKSIFLPTILLSLVSLSIFADDDLPPSREGGLMQTVMMMAIAALFFYFILYRPEQRRRKIIEDQRATLKKGDRVLAMGIIGTIVNVQDQTVIIRMYDGSKIEFLKAAITEVYNDNNSPESEDGTESKENKTIKETKNNS